MILLGGEYASSGRSVMQLLTLTLFLCSQNLLHTSSLPEYTAATLKKPQFILSHYGAFKTAFDWLILIATFYVAIVVPFSATFRDKNNKEPIRTIYLDVFVEVIFIIGTFRVPTPSSDRQLLQQQQYLSPVFPIPLINCEYFSLRQT